MNQENVDKLQKKSDKLGSISWISFIVAGILFCIAFILVVANAWKVVVITLFALIMCILLGSCTHVLSKSYQRKAQVASGAFNSIDDVIEYEEQQNKEQETIIYARQAKIYEEQTRRKKEIQAAQHPQCPACHGYNTQRISTTKRVVSTSLVGLASSTIGKQYECLDCLHKW